MVIPWAEKFLAVGRQQIPHHTSSPTPSPSPSFGPRKPMQAFWTTSWSSSWLSVALAAANTNVEGEGSCKLFLRWALQTVNGQLWNTHSEVVFKDVTNNVKCNLGHINSRASGCLCHLGWKVEGVLKIFSPALPSKRHQGPLCKMWATWQDCRASGRIDGLSGASALQV